MSARALPPESAHWFRFGDGFLHLTSDHVGFRDRFLDMYRECQVPAALSREGAVVGCNVSLDKSSGLIRIAFLDPEPLDQYEVVRSAFAALNPIELSPTSPDRRALRLAGHPGAIEFSPNAVVAGIDTPWQSVGAMLAVHRVLRLQRQVLFFHAGSVSVRGKGLLLFGAKSAGKTTLSLAMADRGQTLYGDEMAAVRDTTAEMLPFRRRVSIRPGPASGGVLSALARTQFPVVTLDDGTVRTRVQPDDLFPRRPLDPVPIVVMAFLEKRAGSARARRFIPALADLSYLQPFASVAWCASEGSVTMRLLRLLGTARCYRIQCGPVEDTAALLEDLMEDS
jgi:hypothetical protein